MKRNDLIDILRSLLFGGAEMDGDAIRAFGSKIQPHTFASIIVSAQFPPNQLYAC